jgi:hypothetical protein
MTETSGKGKSRRTKASGTDEASAEGPDAAENKAGTSPDIIVPPAPQPESASSERDAAESPAAQSPWVAAEPAPAADTAGSGASPAEEPGVPPPPPRRTLNWGWITTALLVILLIGGGASFPLWRHMILPRAADLSAPLAILQRANELQAQRMAALEQQLARLAERGAQAAGTAPAFDPSQIVAIEDRMKVLESQRDNGEAQRAQQAAQQSAQDVRKLASEFQQIGGEMRALAQATQQLQASSAQASTVLRLSERLDAAEASLRQLSQRRGDAEALLLAVGQLRQAVDSARPFDLELRAVRALAARLPDAARAIDSIAPFATKGIPTRTELTERFERLAPLIVRGSLGPDGDGWWPETVQRLASLISIRRIDGDAAGDSVPASVTRAEAAIKAGRLDRALEELSGLQGRPQETARPWIEAAQARTAVDRVLAEFSAQALTNVATPRPAAGGN